MFRMMVCRFNVIVVLMRLLSIGVVIKEVGIVLIYFLLNISLLIGSVVKSEYGVVWLRLMIVNIWVLCFCIVVIFVVVMLLGC